MITPNLFKKILRITSPFLALLNPKIRLILAKLIIYPKGARTLFDPNSIRHFSHLREKGSFKKVKLQGGIELTVDLNDIIGFRTALNNKWDSTSLNLVKKIFSKDLIFIDIGANIGATCIPIAGLKLQIIAIEANLNTAQILFKNILDNQIKQFIVFPLALGANEQDGKFMDISIPVGNISSSSLVQDWSHGSDPVKKQSTYVTTLDRILNSLSFMVTKRNIVIKIDVEGFEAAVINGSVLTIKKHRPIIIFENNPIVNEDSARFLTMFNEIFLEYNIYELTENTSLLDYNPNIRYENAVLIPNEKLNLFEI